MSIKYPIDFTLGANVHQFPKVQYAKIVEIIDAINKITSGTITLTDVELGDGTAALPSLTFASDLSTGLFRVGASDLGVSLGGTKYVDFSTISSTFSNFVVEGSSSITAGTTQTQAGATPITTQRVKVTVGTSGDGVKLPSAIVGLEVSVYNSSASNPMQVYGSGTDTINGQTSTVGVSQPASSIDIYICVSAGTWVAEVGAGFSNGMLTESSRDNIVAAGVIQSTATLIQGQTARITAGSGGGVQLPASAPGLEILLINHSGGPVQVYGNNAEGALIDDLATTTGVSQMGNSMVIYSCATIGNWYTNGIGTGYSGSMPTVSYTNSITAAVGNSLASATQLNTVLNRVTVSTASNTDGVKLVAVSPGVSMTVTNATANTILVWPGVAGDNINSLAAGAAFTLTTNKTVSFTTVTSSPGTWHAVLSA